MTYYAVSQISRDSALQDRIAACAVIEGEPFPDTWAFDNRWRLAASPGWREAYAYALDVGVVTDPGIDQDVISDAMILSAVQALRTTTTSNEE